MAWEQRKTFTLEVLSNLFAAISATAAMRYSQPVDLSPLSVLQDGKFHRALCFHLFHELTARICLSIKLYDAVSRAYSITDIFWNSMWPASQRGLGLSKQLRRNGSCNPTSSPLDLSFRRSPEPFWVASRPESSSLAAAHSIHSSSSQSLPTSWLHPVSLKHRRVSSLKLQRPGWTSEWPLHGCRRSWV